jgi:hypothetical protein
VRWSGLRGRFVGEWAIVVIIKFLECVMIQIINLSLDLSQFLYFLPAKLSCTLSGAGGLY